MINVLFVCLGNICRSPTAHGVFLQQVQQANLQHAIHVDSAGTGDWHIGHAPDHRAIGAAAQRGYALDGLRARQVSPSDFDQFDYVLAMDKQNLQNLQRMCPSNFTGHLSLFLDFYTEQSLREVSDPYYGEADSFAAVLDLVETASKQLLHHIRSQHSL